MLVHSVESAQPRPRDLATVKGVRCTGGWSDQCLGIDQLHYDGVTAIEVQVI